MKEKIIQKQNITLPVLPLRGLVVFPKVMLHFDVGRKKSLKAINKAMKKNQKLFLCTQKDVRDNNPSINELYTTGVVAKIVQVLKQPDNMVRVVVEGKKRGKINKITEVDSYLEGEIEIIEEKIEKDNTDTLGLVRAIKGAFEEYIQLTPKMPSDILFKVGLTNNPGELADYIASNILFDFKVKQSILETIDIKERLEKLLSILTNEVFLMEIETKITQRAKEKIDKNQKDYFLREQLRAIQEEIGGPEDPMEESDQYREKIKELKLTEETEKVLLDECDKLEKMPFGNHEGSVIRTYLDTCISLPWNTYSKEELNLDKIRKHLDKNHYGLTKVKELIIEHLAVKKRAPEAKGQIICLVGPPGVGKTSIAHSIAGAINRKSQRIALGGVKDEAEIRGHRKTYVGAMPGRIIDAIKKAETSNPLIVLDEVDKLSSDYKGDPTSALLEVLDAEQNHSFQDHYLNIPYDLSKVMFITTANNYSAIPAPLRDRMEIIELDSYTREEKYNIARKHLVPKQRKNTGLDAKTFKIDKESLYILIDNYTKEAGVRSLERAIAAVIRKSIVDIYDKDLKNINIRATNIEDLLGPKKYVKPTYFINDEVGVANGLAWTSVGGEILPIEVAIMEGKGKIELTGSLGDVMKESAKIAVSYIRSNAIELGIDSNFYKSYDIHIHAPEGAVPKDGPSAGITMVTAIYSALSLKLVKHNVAMTGEITLRGKVLPIGGLKEKSIAAYRAGIKTIIIPKENTRDLVKIDKEVKEKVKFVPVENIKEAFKVSIKDTPIISSNNNMYRAPIITDRDNVSSTNKPQTSATQ